MKKALTVAATAAISMMAANQAFAQAATQDVDLTATVPSFCTISGGFAPTNLSRDIPISTSGAVNTAALNITGTSPPAVVCNTAANLKAASVSGGVKHSVAGAPPANFANVIDYSASATLGSTVATVNTATVSGAAGLEEGTAVATTGAYSGTLAISVTPATSGLPLIPGSYSDVLRVTITPQ